jgi:TPR repeat protein
MREILRMLMVASLLSINGGIVAAGPLEDAGAAYQRGDYPTALRLIRPLAEQGNAVAQFNLGLMYETDEVSPRMTGKQRSGIGWLLTKDSRMRSSTSVVCTTRDEV